MIILPHMLIVSHTPLERPLLDYCDVHRVYYYYYFNFAAFSFVLSILTFSAFFVTGTVHIYAICRHLMACGHSSKVKNTIINLPLVAPRHIKNFWQVRVLIGHFKANQKRDREQFKRSNDKTAWSRIILRLTEILM